MPLAELRTAIRKTTHMDEHACVEQLLAAEAASDKEQLRAVAVARELVQNCRKVRHGKGTLDAFLQEFGLSNTEGVALMCLAEALLRVPDESTADKLIAEKLRDGDWAGHRGHSDSLFVNASVWGLMLTGRVLPLDSDIAGEPNSWMRTLVNRLGEPVVRKAVRQAMRIIGGQYVLGQTIDEAIKRGHKDALPGSRFSFDMLGEGARTEADAQRYFDQYANAIATIGQQNLADDVYRADGISVKLSALHPRYHYSQLEALTAELLPRIRTLALAAKQQNISLSIDAEEADRLDISLDIFEALARDPELSGWNGLGFVLQAYQKRAPVVADWLIGLAKDSNRRLMVRLVKGAYWDAEIKLAQQQGFVDYPVFTRKVNTDLCYQHCARKLLAAPTAVYPQFATHNGHTVATVLELAETTDFEFQRLQGMGRLLYQQLFRQLAEKMPALRIYAPVGQHRDLLPYLVRRLLENGANNSFVNRFLDQQMPLEQLVQQLEPQVLAIQPHRHPQIPTPPRLYIAAGEARDNSPGIDLNNPIEATPLLADMAAAAAKPWVAGPIVNGQLLVSDPQPVVTPADCRKVVGQRSDASPADIETAISAAAAAQFSWERCGGQVRADMLDKMAQALVVNMASLMGLITAEAGRTVADALAEVREAIDFCRYYATQARCHFAEASILPGPTGETNQLSLHGRGVFLCISPWNFPLAIFTGQIAAALAAGNTVIAKPAGLTPLVATRAVKLFHRAGIPVAALQLLTGDGARLGSLILADQRIAGVAFTGSTHTARLIHQQLANRPGPIIPLIAETGGQNVMLVDSTALPEQVVDDVISSAFLSAGQRCSALRVLMLQQDIADSVLNMLAGALQTYRLGDPAQLSTDIGPVIDQQAQQCLLTHIERMTGEGRLIGRLSLSADQRHGYFVPPHIFEIDALQQLPGEVFGPVLHVIRYRSDELDQLLQQINDSGYGLTLGVHSRIQAFADYIFSHTRVGNTYINRNMVGAVVGSNPFGGCGLSGTGPKAGGPNYLLQFATEKTRTENIAARGGNTALFTLPED